MCGPIPFGYGPFSLGVKTPADTEADDARSLEVIGLEVLGNRCAAPRLRPIPHHFGRAVVEDFEHIEPDGRPLIAGILILYWIP